ncbi:HEAT repeat domain-containing protein [Niabella hibiscisoli]|uniref:HEAT repeat domain-containing protein n=1 Tax=Niabella hibiscisoli TaxID=1825928 RepID=UPI001F0E41E7|nr:HEAT repeat domain-containing protein [Niabella hibiscisoli]MCH5719099.1 HEAT repeat domain-containing protein [Niabella hibiscisoli]
MEAMFQKLALVKNGFKPIEKVAQKIVESHSLSKARQVALHFCGNNIYQVRCCAIFILGYIASKNNQVLEVMKDQAKLDPSWQVQEIIAKAFDQYCRDTGYEQALPTIKGWLNDENPNVCRAVTEGLRIWTSRPFLKLNPKPRYN